VRGQRCNNSWSEYKLAVNARVEFHAMSPARTPNPDPNAEARQRRHATAKAKKLLREGLTRLQAVLDDRFIIDETPLEASDAMQLAADAMHAALHQLDAADSMGHPGATAPAGRTRLTPSTMPPQQSGPHGNAGAVAVASRLEDAGCPDPIMGFDGVLQLTFMNQAAAQFAALPVAALHGLGVDRLTELGVLSGDVAAGVIEVQNRRMAQRVQTSRSMHGAMQWFDVWIVPRGVDEVACFARDITDMKRAETQLRESVGRDSLTGLLNHAAFHDAVSGALAAGGSAAQEVALVLFDLDYLKLINDVHGARSTTKLTRVPPSEAAATSPHHSQKPSSSTGAPGGRQGVGGASPLR
jgi:PAS domain-containing protein